MADALTLFIATDHLRRKHKLSKRKLMRLANSTPQTWDSWATRRTKPSIDVLDRVLNVMGYHLTIEELKK